MTKYRNTIIRMMPRITRTTQANPPCGATGAFFFPFAGLNFAISAMVAPDEAIPMQESRWMTRRTWALLALTLSGCRKDAELPPNLFPETAAGVWRRVELRDLPVSDSPDPLPRNEIERLREASYEGPGKLQARVYQLKSPEVGTELSQRWRPSADTVFLSQGPYFVVVKWQTANRPALQSFLRELETRLGPPAKRPNL